MSFLDFIDEGIWIRGLSQAGVGWALLLKAIVGRSKMTFRQSSFLHVGKKKTKTNLYSIFYNFERLPPIPGQVYFSIYTLAKKSLLSLPESSHFFSLSLSILLESSRGINWQFKAELKLEAPPTMSRFVFVPKIALFHSYSWMIMMPFIKI